MTRIFVGTPTLKGHTALMWVRVWPLQWLLHYPLICSKGRQLEEGKHLIRKKDSRLIKMTVSEAYCVVSFNLKDLEIQSCTSDVETANRLSPDFFLRLWNESVPRRLQKLMSVLEETSHILVKPKLLKRKRAVKKGKSKCVCRDYCLDNLKRGWSN